MKTAHTNPTRLIASAALLASLALCLPAQAVDWQRPAGEEPSIWCGVNDVKDNFKEFSLSFRVTNDDASINYTCKWVNNVALSIFARYSCTVDGITSGVMYEMHASNQASITIASPTRKSVCNAVYKSGKIWAQRK